MHTMRQVYQQTLTTLGQNMEKTSVPQYSARTHNTISSLEQEDGDAQNATRKVITYSTQRVGNTNPPSTESTKNARPALGSTGTVMSNAGSLKNDHHGKANRRTHAGQNTTKRHYHAVKVTAVYQGKVKVTKEMPLPLYRKPAGPRVTRGAPRAVKAKVMCTKERALPLSLRPEGPRATRESLRSPWPARRPRAPRRTGPA